MQVEKTIWVQYTDNKKSITLKEQSSVDDLRDLCRANPDLEIPPTGKISFLWPCGPLKGNPIDVGTTIKELFEEFDKYKEYINRSNPIVINVKENTVRELLILKEKEKQHLQGISKLTAGNVVESQLKELLPLVREQTLQSETIIPFIHDIVLNMFDLVATSDRSTNQDVKLSSINHYNGSTLQNLPDTITCQFLSIELPTKFVTCSHIFQKRWKPHRHLIGLTDIHDWRNTLLLLKPIEILFDQGQIIFLWNQFNLGFEMKILNPAIRSARLHLLFNNIFPNNMVPTNIPNVLIGDLENRTLLTGQNGPYKRCLAFHASVCRYEAIKKSMWIKAEDFPPIPEDAWSPGIAEQPKLRRYLDSWIDSVDNAE